MKAYPEYKASGIDWLGDIPSHWNTILFKRVVNTSTGITFTKSELVEKGHPVVSYGQIHSSENSGVSLNHKLIRYIPENLVKGKDSAIVNKGDFVFADTSEDLDGCGNCILNDSENILYAGYHTIIARNISQNHSKFFSYLFKTDSWRSQLRSRVNGVKVFSITQSILNSTSIVVPSISEQEAIAAYLDERTAKIDALITEKRAQVEELRNYRTSLISETVTRGLNPDAPLRSSGIDWLDDIPQHWETSKLKYIGEARNGLTYSPDDICEENEGVLVLRSSNIQNEQLCFDDNVYVSKQVDELMMQEGDILICSRNGSASLVGKCAIIPKGISATFGAFMMRFRSSINNRFCLYLIRTTLAQHKAQFATSTINQLTNSMIGNMQIALPPLSEQQEIADFLDAKTAKIDALVEELTKQLDELAEYKQAVITEAVMGKVDVRDFQPKN